MGYTSSACFLSRLNISHGDRVVCYPLAANRTVDRYPPRYDIFKHYYLAMLPMYGTYNGNTHSLDNIESSIIWDHYKEATGYSASGLLDYIRKSHIFVETRKESSPEDILLIHREFFDSLDEPVDKPLLQAAIKHIESTPTDAYFAMISFELSRLNLAPRFLDEQPMIHLHRYIGEHEEYFTELSRTWAMFQTMELLNIPTIYPSVPGSREGGYQYQYKFTGLCLDMAERKLESLSA